MGDGTAPLVQRGKLRLGEVELGVGEWAGPQSMWEKEPEPNSPCLQVPFQGLSLTHKPPPSLETSSKNSSSLVEEWLVQMGRQRWKGVDEVTQLLLYFK